MDMTELLVVVISGTGGLALGFLNFQRAACLVGIVGQPFWLHHTWDGPLGYFIVAVAATLAYLLGILLHWVLPWWTGRTERRRQRQRRASW